MSINPKVRNHRIIVIEYDEGCGYNILTSWDINNEHFEFWQSKIPFNQANIETLLTNKLKDFPESEVVLPKNFFIKDENLLNFLQSR